jgi:hypothetical protein
MTKAIHRTQAILPRHRSRPRGALAIEVLIALPVLMLLAFAIAQLGMLWHARLGLTHAVSVAARQASVSNGSDSSIRDGLVTGLFPLVSKVDSVDDLAAGILQTSSELAAGVAGGWVRWDVLSPTEETFQDWGVRPDRFLESSVAADELEIPALGLSGIVRRREPKSGIRERIDGMPVGVRSGQTLLEANVFKLRLTFGVPLNMPFAGQLMARTLAWWHGCGVAGSSLSQKIGVLDFGPNRNPAAFGLSMQCSALSARDRDGRWRPRWPIEVTASVQMQSNARRSAMSIRRYSTN